MPRTVLEAMAAGKPVVATDIRGCREEVLHGVTGLLVPVKNPLAFAEAISRLLVNREEAAGMGEAGRRRAQGCFNEKIVVDYQVLIYKEMEERRQAQSGCKRVKVLPL
jgi:glycosyltransferase involved in cell wall biosynthesis